MAFYARNPFGPRQEDYRAATVHQMLGSLLQAWCSERISLPAITELFPSLKERGERARQSPETMMRIARMWCQAMGGQVIEATNGQ